MSLAKCVVRKWELIGAIAAICHSVDASDVKLALENGKVLHCDVRLFAVDHCYKSSGNGTGVQEFDIRNLTALLKILDEKNRNGTTAEAGDIADDTDVRSLTPGVVATTLKRFVEGGGQVVVRDGKSALALVNEREQQMKRSLGQDTNPKPAPRPTETTLPDDYE